MRKVIAHRSRLKPKLIQSQIPQWLDSNSQRRVEAEVALILDANQKLFADERDKLDKWADDKIFAAETELTDIKTRIAANKREARKAETTEQQVALQNSLRELERQQRQKRQAIFEVEDQISEQRDALIADLQKRLTQDIQNDTVFTIRWCVV
jgi:predicted  nucleic acid-binding Zn-ribbon protein